MKAKTEALKRVLKSWRSIADGIGIDGGSKDSDNLALCKLYLDRYCTECPIMLATGARCCLGTPYMSWHWHQLIVHGKCLPTFALCPICKRIAREMVYFLEVLLEPHENKP